MLLFLGGAVLFFFFLFTLAVNLDALVVMWSFVLKKIKLFISEEEKDAVSDEDRKETSPEVLEAQFVGK